MSYGFASDDFVRKFAERFAGDGLTLSRLAAINRQWRRLVGAHVQGTQPIHVRSNIPDLQEILGVVQTRGRVHVVHHESSWRKATKAGVEPPTPVPLCGAHHALASRERTGPDGAAIDLANFYGVKNVEIQGYDVVDLGPLCLAETVKISNGVLRASLEPLRGARAVVLENLAAESRFDLAPLSCVEALTIDAAPFSAEERADVNTALAGVRDLTVKNFRGLVDASAFREARRLVLDGCSGVRSVAGLARPGLRLTLANMPWLRDSDLDGLAGLQSLELRNCDGITRLSPALRSVRELALVELANLASLDTGISCPESALEAVRVQRCPLVRSLEPLATVETVELISCPSITSVAPLKAVKKLAVSMCWNVCWEGWSAPGTLVDVALAYMPDFDHVSGLRGVPRVALTSCAGVTDVSPLSQAQHVEITGLSKGCVDLTPLVSVRSLSVKHCHVPDLRPFAHVAGPLTLASVCRPRCPNRFWTPQAVCPACTKGHDALWRSGKFCFARNSQQ